VLLGIVVNGMLRFSAMSERRRRPLGTHLECLADEYEVYGHVPGYNQALKEVELARTFVSLLTHCKNH
jgi:hypothetical protein